MISEQFDGDFDYLRALEAVANSNDAEMKAIIIEEFEDLVQQENIMLAIWTSNLFVATKDTPLKASLATVLRLIKQTVPDAGIQMGNTSDARIFFSTADSFSDVIQFSNGDLQHISEPY